MSKIGSIIFDRFRCFGEEQRATIRPITLLVGENSTGKTSFLGGYRALDQVLSGSAVNFNKPPFHMGAFADLIHRNSGRKFHIGCTVRNGSIDAETVLGFTKHNSAIEVSSIRISVDGSIDMSFSRLKGGKTSVSIPNQKTIHFAPTTHKFINLIDLAEKLLFDLAVHAGKLEAGDKRAPRNNANSHRPEYYFDETEIRKLHACLSKSGMAETIWELFQSELKRIRRPDARNLKVRLSGTFIPKSFGKIPVIPVAPVRSKPQRTYDAIPGSNSPEGEFIPVELMNLKVSSPKKWKDLKKSLVDFGKDSELMSDISIQEFNGGNAPFQLHVGIRDAKQTNIADVGYGVSQALPILVEILSAGNADSTFLLQQPEVHLHPKAQVALATLMTEACRRNNPTFIVETHSDYIIDRFRIEVRKKRIKPSDISILCFAPNPGKGVTIHDIELDENANMIGAPNEYREFFLRETNRLLGFE